MLRMTLLPILILTLFAGPIQAADWKPIEVPGQWDQVEDLKSHAGTAWYRVFFFVPARWGGGEITASSWSNVAPYRNRPSNRWTWWGCRWSVPSFRAGEARGPARTLTPPKRSGGRKKASTGGTTRKVTK